MMNSSTDAHDHGHDHKTEQAIAAVFESREEARQAIATLHKHHYTHSWFGVTSSTVKAGGEPTVTIEQPGFFSLKSQNIVDALVAHGVPGETARALEPTLVAGQAIVIIDPKDKDPGEATDLLQSAGGELVATAIARSSSGQERGRIDPATAWLDDDSDIEYREEVYYYTIE